MYEIAGHSLLFLMVYAVAQLLAAIAVGLMALYTFKYSKPVDWEKNPGSFHPLLMTIGLIFCYAQGMLVFRIFRYRKKPTLKIFHFLLQLTAFCCVVAGLKAEYNSISSGIHAHSLHSWMGLGTVVLFACQLTCGFVTFLFPGLQLRLRQFYLPIHTFFGLAIFVMGVATAMMGVTQKILWTAQKDYEDFQPNATILKCFSLATVLLALALAFGVGNSLFKRVPLPEEIQDARESVDNLQNGSFGSDMSDLKRRHTGDSLTYS